MPMPANVDTDWRLQRIVKVNGEWTVDGRPTNKVAVNWKEAPSNAEGKLYIGLKVTAPVNAASPPHRHGGAAVAATVIKGRILNQMICSDGHVVGPQIYEAGESWYEPPGCHHVRSSNAGDEEAMFIAAFIVDETAIQQKGVLSALVQFDADESDQV